MSDDLYTHPYSTYRIYIGGRSRFTKHAVAVGRGVRGVERLQLQQLVLDRFTVVLEIVERHLRVQCDHTTTESARYRNSARSAWKSIQDEYTGICSASSDSDPGEVGRRGGGRVDVPGRRRRWWSQ